MLRAKQFLFVGLGVVTLSCLSMTTSAAEFAVNGNFETGDTTGWSAFDPTFFTVVSADPFEGTYNGQLNNPGPGAGAKIAKQANVGVGVVQPNSPITISFWARGSTAAGGVQFAELFSELAGGGVSKTELLGGAPLFAPSDWTEYTFNTTTGADVMGGVTLQFAAVTGGDPGSMSLLEIDNVSISQIPEPASFALLGLAAVGLVARRRR